MAQAIVNQTNILLETGTNELEVISFYLQWIDPENGQSVITSYGINAAKVMEMVAMPDEITNVFESNHPCTKGVFLLRDRTIPLIDLSVWFQYEADTDPEVKQKWTVIVAELNGKPFGFISHGVDKVHRVSWETIKPPPELIATCKSITGICLVENQLIQMVDFEQIVSVIDPAMNITKRAESANIDYDKLGGGGSEIVIADDSATILMQERALLEEAGYIVHSFPDGQAAWDFLEGLRGDDPSTQRIAAVVSDIEMPKMDGHHLCSKIKEDRELKKLPVILFSSMINDALRRKGESVGADDQITKPEISSLVDRLHSILQNKAA